MFNLREFINDLNLPLEGDGILEVSIVQDNAASCPVSHAKSFQRHLSDPAIKFGEKSDKEVQPLSPKHCNSSLNEDVGNNLSESPPQLPKRSVDRQQQRRKKAENNRKAYLKLRSFDDFEAEYDRNDKCYHGSLDECTFGIAAPLPSKVERWKHSFEMLEDDGVGVEFTPQRPERKASLEDAAERWGSVEFALQRPERQVSLEDVIERWGSGFPICPSRV